MISRKDLSSFFSQDIEPIVIKQIDNKDTDMQYFIPIPKNIDIFNLQVAKQKKKFKKALIYDIHPYPKGDNKKYDCPDIKNGKIVK